MKKLNFYYNKYNRKRDDLNIYWLIPTIQIVNSKRDFTMYLLFLNYCIEIEYLKVKL